MALPPPACSIYTHGRPRRGAQGLEEEEWAKEGLYPGSFSSVILGHWGGCKHKAIATQRSLQIPPSQLKEKVKEFRDRVEMKTVHKDLVVND